LIPEDVNWIGVLDELNRLGISDSTTEDICKFTKGYVGQIRCGNVKRPEYTKGAKMINLLDEEMALANKT